MKEDLKQKTEIIEKNTETPVERPVERQPFSRGESLDAYGVKPRIIERIIEKEPKIIKEAPDYNNIPEEIILKEFRQRQVTQRENKQIKRQENMKN